MTDDGCLMTDDGEQTTGEFTRKAVQNRRALCDDDIFKLAKEFYERIHADNADWAVRYG